MVFLSKKALLVKTIFQDLGFLAVFLGVLLSTEDKKNPNWKIQVHWYCSSFSLIRVSREFKGMSKNSSLEFGNRCHSTVSNADK